MSRYATLFSDNESNDDRLTGAENKPAPYRILLVDDEVNVIRSLRRVFHDENYKIITASSGQEALNILKKIHCQLMITDYMMPGINGADLLRKVKELYPDMIRIMLTGHADTGAVMAAIKEGAVYKFILKPWNDDDLRVTVALALEQYDLLLKNKNLKKQNRDKTKEIKALTKLTINNRSQLAIMLHKRNMLNDKQVQEIYKQQQVKKIPTIKIILHRGWVTENDIRDRLRKELMIEEVSLDEIQVDPAIAALLTPAFCERQMVLPIAQDNNRLTLVMADPLDMGLVEDLRFSIGMNIYPVMANISDIKAKIKEVYGGGDISLEAYDSIVDSSDPYEGIEVLIDDDDDLTLDELLQGSDEPPAIRLVNAIILEAIRLGASDIHIHPRAKSIVVRYRIDGVLLDKIQIPHNLHMSLASRIKVMAELDITERRRPQDGRITVKTSMRIIDLRISSLPTINGEKIVMRMLDRNATVHELEDLGFSPGNLAKIKDVVTKPQGIILATGPTGSGKTTSLYSMLNHNADSEKNYVTIEDPVEYYLDSAAQVMVKEKIGLDFATVLRSILRQDPDVILLGEIRDYETAEVTFHAALTGHLVFSTLHTNSAIATIARLFDLGMKPYVVATGLEAIIAQRLVRRICDYCKAPYEASPEQIRKLGPAFTEHAISMYKGTGCEKCNKTGYHGRVGLYEVLIPSEEMRLLISTGASILEIGKQAEKDGITTLLNDARDKVNKGLTTVEEVLRVVGVQLIS